jgi:hypothetical protein
MRSRKPAWRAVWFPWLNLARPVLPWPRLSVCYRRSSRRRTDRLRDGINNPLDDAPVGAYNVFRTTREEPCPRCGSHDYSVQFRFADTWQRSYAIGDQLTWGGNEVGEPGLPAVTVGAYPENCLTCGLEGEDRVFALDIENDRPVRVRAMTPSETETLLAEEERRGW